MDNCFTATARGIVAGITLTTPTTLDLGEAGRSRRLVRVPVEGARVDAGRVVEAGATRRPSLVAPKDDGLMVVRVKTDKVYTRGCPGKIGAPCGAMGVIAEGLTAWGDAGGLGSHPDVLLAMRPGSAIVITFSGGRGKGQGVRLLVYPTWLPAPVIIDLGAEDMVASHPDLDAATVLGTVAVFDEVIGLVERGDPAAVNTLARLKARREKLNEPVEQF